MWSLGGKKPTRTQCRLRESRGLIAGAAVAGGEVAGPLAGPLAGPGFGPGGGILVDPPPVPGAEPPLI